VNVWLVVGDGNVAGDADAVVLLARLLAMVKARAGADVSLSHLSAVFWKTWCWKPFGGMTSMMNWICGDDMDVWIFQTWNKTTVTTTTWATTYGIYEGKIGIGCKIPWASIPNVIWRT